MDPEVAQDFYSKSDLDNAIDSLDHKHRKEEIQDLQSLRKSILKHAYKFEHYHIIQTAYRIDGIDLNKTLIDLLDNLDDMIGFGEHKRRLETTGTRANKRAHEVAWYADALFEAEGRNCLRSIAFIVSGYNSSFLVPNALGVIFANTRPSAAV